MKLWLDDIREPWKHGRIGWTWAKTAQEAITHLRSGEVTQLSLDHDLEPQHYPTPADPDGALADSGTGYDVALFIEENPWFYPQEGCYIHTMNPAGRQRMFQALNRAYNWSRENVARPQVVSL